MPSWLDDVAHAPTTQGLWIRAAAARANRDADAAVLIAPEVYEALHAQKPVVALESAVITHGLPAPHNLQVALDMEEEVRAAGALPATIGLWEGRLVVGLSPSQIEALALMAHDARARHRRLAAQRDFRLVKISVRDFAPLLAARDPRLFGGTTVAATLAAAHGVGIRFFATGGIGGVHHDPPYDISADLPQLARTPVVTVCAGAKAILNLDATLEYLETWGVPVVGYRTGRFPAFYSADSPWSLRYRVDTPQEAARLAQTHWELRLPTAVLLTVPPPPSAALKYEYVRQLIAAALEELRQHNRQARQGHGQPIRGAAVTPWLLQRLTELSDQRTLQTNLALLRHNARVAGQVARAWVNGLAEAKRRGHA